VVVGEIPALELAEPDEVDHAHEGHDDEHLGEDVEANLEALDFAGGSRVGRGIVLSHDEEKRFSGTIGTGGLGGA
jgi:hypothetical protein